jgi:hypothetical protein
VGSSNGSAPLGTNGPNVQQAAVRNNSSGGNRSSNDSADKAEKTEACKDRYRDQIDAIDAQMRNGYDSEQGEVYRERLRRLTSSMREC